MHLFFILLLILLLTVSLNLYFISLYSFSCIPDGIESPIYATVTLGLGFFLSLIFSSTSYSVAINADKPGLNIFRYLNILYLIYDLVVLIISFVDAGSFDSSNIVNTWASLNELDRIHFNNNI